MTTVVIYSHSDYDVDQLQALIESVRERGYQIIGKFEDAAASEDYPELHKMLNLVKEEKADLVITPRFQYLGQSIISIADVLNMLIENDTEISFTDQPVDICTICAAADVERALIRKRTCEGLKRAKKDGKTGGRPATKLSELQKNKIQSILKENPNISNRQLAAQFIEVSSNTLIKLAKKEGLI